MYSIIKAVRIDRLFIGILALIFSSGSAYAQSLHERPNDPSSFRTDMDRYCVTCHNESLQTANLMLDRADLSNLEETPALWEKVLLKLRTRSMPPAGMPKPNEQFYVSFSNYLENTLDSLAETNPNPGRIVSAHRLNRTEYTNAVRDLLGVNIDGDQLLPPDNSGDFDNLGELLSVSSILMEKYLSVAHQVSQLAIGDPSIGIDTQQHTISPFLLQNDRMSEDLPFGTRGGLAVKHRFPLDGEYEFNVRLLRTDGTGFVIGLGKPNRLEIRIDGKRISVLTIGGENIGLAQANTNTFNDGPPDFDQAQYERTADENLKVRIPIKAGEHLVQIAFLEENFAWESPVPRRNFENYTTARLRGNYARAWADPSASSVTITGPFDIKGLGQTASREKIFICNPTSKADEEPCAKKIFSKLARSAYRRPVADEEIEPLLSLYREGVKQGGTFEAGIQMGLEGILVGPKFLFRVYGSPEKIASNKNHPIDDIDLASRLSFFLWSSIPDDELLALAENGELSKPSVLDSQVKRMLKDERAGSLTGNFSEQWLFLRNLSHIHKNQELFPEFDENLRKDLYTESQLFIGSIFKEDRSILDLFRVDYRYLNERLARHYDIPDVYENRFRRVKIDDKNKKGLLAHGSIMAITSYPNRTSPVLRGQWVLGNILASPAPPPPASIPALVEQDESGEALSMRAAIEKHRANPVCATCHNRMDPIGFGLENFNPIGQWRTTDAGQPVDSSGMLHDGSEFQGPAELQNALLKQPGVIANAFTQKLLTYALGRDLEYYDMPVVRNIVEKSAGNDYRFSDIVIGIVNSLPFTMRRSES
jgi:hypothetical protein